MRLNNMEIRLLIEQRRLRYDEVAKELGIHQCTLSHWLQTELTPDKKEVILEAIKRIKT